MQNNLNNQKPVEFFSAERIKIEIDGQQILWRDMKLEIDSRIGEHTIGKIKYIGSVNQLSLYDALIDRKGDKEINVLRTEQALEVHPDIIATACPFCNTMMTDGVKTKEKETQVKIYDIAELMANENTIL